MALQVLAINGMVGESAEFTLSDNTLIWLHGSGGSNAMLGLDVKGSDGKFTGIETLMADGTKRGGVLPAGDYRVTRLGGVCGLQRAA